MYKFCLITLKTTVGLAILSAGISACSPQREPSQPEDGHAPVLHSEQSQSDTAPAPSAHEADANTDVNTNVNTNVQIWPKLNLPVTENEEIEKRIRQIMNSMTLEQKVAQTIQPEIRDITVEDMRRYGFGSYLNGGGSFPKGNKHATAADWIKLADDMFQASVDDSLDGSTIPTMWGTDAVHGHNNVIGATLFPHNIGLGAMRNPDLVREIAAVTAKEVLVTGIDWVFAPTVATVQNDRWGRTYESYAEDPQIVHDYSRAIVEGLQGVVNENFLANDKVLSTVKHFIGDGGTVGGDDQGNNIDAEQRLFAIHGQGYVGGLEAGSQSVMASFNSWHGKKIHGSRYLLNDVLKQRMGFDGFVVGDWNGHGQVSGCSNESCPQAMNAGLDIFMVPTQAWKPLFENTVAQVKSGVIPMERLDDAVARILRVKLRMGLFERKNPAKRELAARHELIGLPAHREVARRAVRESLVLLKNQDKLLPLSPKQHILLAGDGANNIGKQSGGWTITWQGTGNKNSDFPGATSIYQGVAEQVNAAGGSIELNIAGDYEKKPDVAIVVFGEDPYAEGHGDRENVDYKPGDNTDLQLLNKLKKAGIATVSVFITGRPLWVNPELNASDAFVVAWLPGSEGGGVADVLLRDKDGNEQYPISGKLSFSWPASPYDAAVNIRDADSSGYHPLFPFGYGLRFADEGSIAQFSETFDAPEEAIKPREIFSSRVQKPWHMWLFSGDELQEVNSNTLTLPGLAFRTMDKQVQEDAFSVALKGGLNSGVRFMSFGSFREDLRTDVANQGALQFSVNLMHAPSDKVFLQTVCHGGEGVQDEHCGAKLDISHLLNNVPLNSWQNISVDLACFQHAGMRFGATVSPFELSSEAEIKLGLADIQIVPKTAENALMRCQ